MSKAFLEEAKIRWRVEAAKASITAISAAILLTLTCNHHGNDRDGLIFLDASADMGRHLHLFDHADMSASPLDLDDEEVRSAASYASWGAFGWHT